MGEGLWGGLYRAFEDDPTLEFIQRANESTGLARPDRYDWDAELDKILKDENYQIAVVMFGGNDMQPIREGKNVFKVGTEEWRQAYGKRVEKFIRKLREANIAVYWAGLPVMRSPGQSSDAEKLNDVFREKAFVNGAKYVDTWDGFVDESGRYSAYGPDMTGQVKRLRANDGVHFTMRGNVKLANFVEKELRKDLKQAKAERNIPLAGNEQEQDKVKNRFALGNPPLIRASRERKRQTRTSRKKTATRTNCIRAKLAKSASSGRRSATRQSRPLRAWRRNPSTWRRRSLKSSRASCPTGSPPWRRSRRSPICRSPRRGPSCRCRNGPITRF